MPEWTTSVTQFNCPFLYELTITENGAERALTSADLAVVTFDNLTGEIQIATSDFTYDTIEWTFKVTKTSQLSTTAQREASVSIEVTFKDICWDSTLVAPQFIQSSLTFDLY